MQKILTQSGIDKAPEVNILPLLKAFKKFDEFRANDKTEQERAGIIQAFEYCFELNNVCLQRASKAQS